MSAAMSESKGARFSEKEKVILYGLFKKYQHIIDIRHRRYSQHKQAELRKCWDTILETFNASSETSERTIKQIQKFWLNAKLRNRLPSQSSTSSDGKHKKSTASNAPVSASSASASTATATTKLRNSDHEIKDIQYKLIKLKAHGLDTDSNTDVTSGSKDYEEKYSNQLQITEAYQVEYDENNLQGALIVNSQGIDTKLIDNAQTLTTTAPSLSAANTFIINSIEHISANGLTGDGASLLNATTANNLRTRLEPVHAMPPPTNETMYLSRDPPLGVATTDLGAYRKQEMELRLRELQLKVETEEIRKDMAREELQHMRHIHKMKVREMELRLKNIDRT